VQECCRGLCRLVIIQPLLYHGWNLVSRYATLLTILVMHVIITNSFPKAGKLGLHHSQRKDIMSSWLVSVFLLIWTVVSSPAWRQVGFILFWMSALQFMLALQRAIWAGSREAATEEQLNLSIMGAATVMVAVTIFRYSPPGGTLPFVTIALSVFVIGFLIAHLKGDASRK